MPQRFLSSQPTALAGSVPDHGLLRDIAWGRPIFRPPQLPNPRVVFDPLPFRTQLFSAARRVRRLARR